MAIQKTIENAFMVGRYYEDLKRGDISKANAKDLSGCLRVLSKELEREQPSLSKSLIKAATVCESGKSAPCLVLLKKIG